MLVEFLFSFNNEDEISVELKLAEQPALPEATSGLENQEPSYQERKRQNRQKQKAGPPVWFPSLPVPRLPVGRAATGSTRPFSYKLVETGPCTQTHQFNSIQSNPTPPRPAQELQSSNKSRSRIPDPPHQRQAGREPRSVRPSRWSQRWSR